MSRPFFVILAIFLSTFNCMYSCQLSSQEASLSWTHRISCPAHHLERTDNKPFSGLIGPRHMTTIRAVTHQNWVARCSLAFCNLGKAFKHNTIYLPFTFQGNENNNNNNSLLLLFDGLWKVKTDFMVYEDKLNTFYNK